MSVIAPSDRTLRGAIGTSTLCFAVWVWLPGLWEDALHWPILVLIFCCLASGVVLNRRTRRRQAAADATVEDSEGSQAPPDDSFRYPVSPRTGFATGPYIDWTGVVMLDSVLVREAVRPVTRPLLPGHWDTLVLLTLALVITVVAAVASQRERRGLRPHAP